MMKQCSRCKELQPVENFGRDASRADGLSMFCRSCIKIRNRGQRANRADWAKRRRASEPLRPCRQCGAMIPRRRWVCDGCQAENVAWRNSYARTKALTPEERLRRNATRRARYAERREAEQRRITAAPSAS